MLRKIINFLNTRPWLRQQLVLLANKIRVYDIIKRSYYYLQRVLEGEHSLVGRGKIELDQLTPRAQQIYHDLKKVVEKNKEQQ